MKIDFDYLPRPGDFFPSLRRGHGTIHKPTEKHPKAGKCASTGCKGDKHIDKQANIDDWISDHGRDSNPLGKS